MNKHDQEFIDLKEKINEMASEMGYKVRYYTGPIGEPLKLEVDNVPVRGLRVQHGKREIVVAKLNNKVYAFANGQRWDITANFMFYEAQRYCAMEEKLKRKLRKEEPLLATFEMVISKMISSGLDINETFDIFTPCQQQSYPLREIRI